MNMENLKNSFIKYFSIYYAYGYYKCKPLSKRKYKALNDFERIIALNETIDRNYYCIFVNVILIILVKIAGTVACGI
jgi:hypothetical protein